LSSDGDFVGQLLKLLGSDWHVENLLHAQTSQQRDKFVRHVSPTPARHRLCDGAIFGTQNSFDHDRHRGRVSDRHQLGKWRTGL
jgi:hypothetical protein